MTWKSYKELSRSANGHECKTYTDTTGALTAATSELNLAGKINHEIFNIS